MTVYLMEKNMKTEGFSQILKGGKLDRSKTGKLEEQEIHPKVSKFQI